MTKKSDQEVTIIIHPSTVIRVLLSVLVFLISIALVRQLAQPLTLLFISFLLALALNPAVSKIAGKLKSKSRVRATGMAYVLVVLFLVAFFAFVVPPLVRQTADFIQTVPDTIHNITRDDSPVSKFIDRYNLQDQVNQFGNDFRNRFKDVGGPVLDTAGAIGAAVVNTITILVLTFMMLVEGPAWMDRIWSIQDPRKRERRRTIAYKMYKVVTAYVNGQVIIAALGGFFASIALFIFSQIFDASINPVALGGIISLFALLPLIGTTIGSIIVTLACLLVSAPLALAFAVYFLIYQQVENITIQPYIQSRGSSLTPLLVFGAALIGVGVGGFLGAFVAIPAAGCIKILVEDYFDRRNSGKLKTA